MRLSVAAVTGIVLFPSLLLGAGWLQYREASMKEEVMENDQREIRRLLACSDAFGNEGVGADLEFLDTSVIANLPDSHLAMTLLEWGWRRLPDGAVQPKDVAGFPPGIRLMLAVAQVDGEVNNGGFNQYFSNSNGVFAGDAIAGFRLLGSETRAAAVEEALRIRVQEASRIQPLHAEHTLEALFESYLDSSLGAAEHRYHSDKSCLWQQMAAAIRREPRLFVER